MSSTNENSESLTLEKSCLVLNSKSLNPGSLSQGHHAVNNVLESGQVHMQVVATS